LIRLGRLRDILAEIARRVEVTTTLHRRVATRPLAMEGVGRVRRGV